MVEPNDTNVIDTTALLPEERFNVLLLMISSALKSCELGEDFILITRQEKVGRWVAHTTIHEEEKMKEILTRMSSEAPNAKEVRNLNLEDYSVESQKRKTKQ